MNSDRPRCRTLVTVLLVGLSVSCGNDAERAPSAGSAGNGGSTGPSGSAGGSSSSPTGGAPNGGSAGSGGLAGRGGSDGAGAGDAAGGGSGAGAVHDSGATSGDTGAEAGNFLIAEGGASEATQDSGGSMRDASAGRDANSDHDTSSPEAGPGSDGGVRSMGCGKPFTRPNPANPINITIGGMNRAYQLFVPPNYASDGAYPLVVTFHGGGGSAASSRAEMRLESAPKGIVVYLNYVNNGWSYAEGASDVAYYQAVTTAVENQYCIDTHRVLVTGFSLGAIQTNGLGCTMGGRSIRAIVPIDGSGPYPQPAPPAESVLACPAGTPVGDPAVMVIHGSADTTALYEYGQWSANYWRKANGCDPTPVSLTAPMNNCVGYQRCRAPVNFCTHSGNHMVPTTAGALVWAFLDTLK